MERRIISIVLAIVMIAALAVTTVFADTPHEHSYTDGVCACGAFYVTTDGILTLNGGGMYNSTGTLNMTGGAISGNTATNFGGAVYSFPQYMLCRIIPLRYKSILPKQPQSIKALRFFDSYGEKFTIMVYNIMKYCKFPKERNAGQKSLQKQ